MSGSGTGETDKFTLLLRRPSDVFIALCEDTCDTSSTNIRMSMIINDGEWSFVSADVERFSISLAIFWAEFINCCCQAKPRWADKAHLLYHGGRIKKLLCCCTQTHTHERTLTCSLSRWRMMKGNLNAAPDDDEIVVSVPKTQKFSSKLVSGRDWAGLRQQWHPCLFWKGASLFHLSIKPPEMDSTVLGWQF